MFKIENVKEDMIPYIEWSNHAQKLYDRNRKVIEKIEKKYGLASWNCDDEKDNSWVAKIDEICDNVFILTDGQGNIFAYTSEAKLIGRSKLRVSDPSIIRLSSSKKIMGISS